MSENNKRRSGRVQRQQSVAAATPKWDNDSMREAKKQKYLTDLERDNFIEAAEDTESSSSEDDLLKKNKRRGEKVEKKKNRAIFARSGTKTRKNCTSFDQVLELEKYESYDSHIPTYLTQAAAPSKLPPRKFSPESGYVANYVDPRSGTRFVNANEQQVIKARKSGLQ